jgi:hypothetical protein
MFLDWEMYGPGAAFYVKKKYPIAITTGIRYRANASNLDNNVFQSMGANPTPDSVRQRTYNLNNFNFTAQVFKEVNISYAKILSNTDVHSLIVGVTLKGLIGMGAAGLGVPQASYTTMENDGTAYGLTGRANIAFTPYANKFLLSNSPLNASQNSANNMGLGLNLGALYELYYYNGYNHRKVSQAKFALSVTDIGSINYSSSSTSGSYTITNQNLNYRGIQNIPGETIGNRIFNEYLLDTLARAKSNSSKFKVQLPTALRFNTDINLLEERFYLNANMIINLVKPSSSAFANYYVSTFTFTPRYVYDKLDDIGFAVPFSFNNLGQGSMGGVVFAGPYFIGSSSLFNMLVSGTFNKLDFFTGFTLRLKPRRLKEKDYMMM